MDTHKTIFPTPKSWETSAYITKEKFKDLSQKAIENPDGFWEEQALRLKWQKKWTQTSDCSFASPVNINWFKDGQLNVSENCLDRHLAENADRIAFHWEPDNPEDLGLKFTYQEVYNRVCKLSNVFKSMGIQKGDRVTVYLPMIPEAVFTMLACARIGAVHSVVFAGFSPAALADRISSCESDFVITADEGFRAGRKLPLKKNVDAALKIEGRVKKVLVVKRTSGNIDWDPQRDLWYHDEMDKADCICAPEVMNAEDHLFILYTSGSTSKPKGILHTTAGYLTYASYTHEKVFNYKKEDIYWCAADVGWVTGHSYIVYGPLSNCATSVLFEGVPTYPTASRIWEIVDKYQVNTLYTAPTLIRSLISAGNDAVLSTSRKSLKLLGSVGEPINKEAWLWYHDIAGEGRCPIVDTWWQTETGGIMITPLPGATDLKPGSASFPLPGIQLAIVNSDGKELQGPASGLLCIKNSWPGQMRGIYGDPERFFQTYFSQYPGKYFTGDGCRRDEDGYYWITGRVDDVLNVSGHRLGTAEIESSIDGNDHVAEAAVVGFPHDIKGEGIYAFVTLKAGVDATDDLKKILIQKVRTDIGPIAAPEYIQWAQALPKTRSGKIMRRILRKIAENTYDTLGDISTLAEPAVVDELIAGRLVK